MTTCVLCHERPAVADGGMLCAHCRALAIRAPEARPDLDIVAAARRAAKLAAVVFAEPVRPAVVVHAAADTLGGRPAVAVGVGLMISPARSRWQLRHETDDGYEPIGPPGSFDAVLATAFGCWCDHIIHTYASAIEKEVD